MALTTRALTTMEAAEVFLARTGTQGAAIQEADDDTYLELLVNAYSDAIRDYCEREFKPQVAAETRRFRYNGSGLLSLAPYDLRTVTAITMNADLPTASQTVLSAGSATTEADYRLEPPQKTLLGTYLALTLPLNRYTNSEVSVAGAWGAATIPASIELACLIAVRDAYPTAGGGGLSSPFDGDDPGAGDSSVSSLPQAARALLGPYKRRRPPFESVSLRSHAQGLRSTLPLA